MTLPDGILLVDKPSGITSFRVVDRLKKRFSLRKAGHGGSLDPMATGLLVVLINRGTKQASALLAGDKEYLATILMGTETDSQDITGRVTRKVDKISLGREAIEEILERFRGEIRQVPPMVSALKHRGERLYAIARRGEEVPRPPRTVIISELTMLDLSGLYLKIKIRCSKGTYIRTLSYDLGRILGCGACLAALRRTAVGPFRLADAYPLSKLLAGSREELASRIISIKNFGSVLFS